MKKLIWLLFGITWVNGYKKIHIYKGITQKYGYSELTEIYTIKKAITTK